MTKELFKPVIVKKEVDDEHYYYVNDVFYPSVTHILGEGMPMGVGLLKWYGNLGTDNAEAERDRLADRGKAIHDACETLLYGKTVKLKDYKKMDAKCIVSFVNWLAVYQPEILGVEMTLASSKRYAGTLDIFCKINPEIIKRETKLVTDNWYWIIDLKTTKSIHISHKIQQIAYRDAMVEMYDIRANTALLHLNYKTKIGYSFITDFTVGDLILDTQHFMLAYEMYKMLNGGVIPEPNLEDAYPDELKLAVDGSKITTGTKLLPTK